jgi:hypothetical protein
MKNEDPFRRCTECTRRFEPDPRIGHRQVTCGTTECQRGRHSGRCRAWHEAHPESAASHYEDVVAPFRQQQPSYQRRWRLGRRLREIREMTGRPGAALLKLLRGLLQRAEGLSKRAAEAAQTGVLAANLLEKATGAVRGAIAALEGLEASMATLGSMGL